MVTQNNIRVIFTLKADDALSEIIKKYKLEESSAMVKIDYVAKAFAVEKISEKEIIDYLQKELNISSQIANQVSKEIILKIIPLLEKIPEESFENPELREKISNKIFGSAIDAKKDTVSFLKVEAPTDINELMGKNNLSPKSKNIKEETNTPPLKKIKKTPLSEDSKNFVPEIKQSKEPDNYRESI